MPWEQALHMKEEGDLKFNRKFGENIEQLNGYLNDLDLPAGMLVYVSSEMDVKEYVVERHNDKVGVDNRYREQFLHEREDYDFSNLVSRLDN